MKMVRSCENKKKKKQQVNNGGNKVAVELGILQVKKGPWTPEEDRKLRSYVQQFGHGSWRSLPAKAGLKRCGKSCRFRWMNYLRPDIKRGKFSFEEENMIIQLHALLGNRWSAIASHLPRRTDNDIKNHWNAHIRRRMAKMGIDPMTHKRTQHLGSNLNHMAQWEVARLEAEARLAQKPTSNLTQPTYDVHVSPSSINEYHKPLTKVPPDPYLQCLDVLKVWQGNLGSNSAINNNESVKSLISSTSNGSVATHTTLNQTEVEPFEEFKCNNDLENFMIINDNPLSSPDFWEDFVFLDGDLISTLTDNFSIMSSSPPTYHMSGFIN